MESLDIWAPVVAAVGASSLTAMATFGIAYWQARRAERHALAGARRRAYADLISVTGLMIHSGWMLRLTMEMRSGLGEGIDVALRFRRPLDPMELDSWMRRDLDPLYSAWTDVWTVGSVAGVSTANRLVERVGEVVSEATAYGEARGRLAARVVGEKWSEEQMEEWLRKVDDLGEDRRALADLARRETGVDVAEFVTGLDS